MCYYYVSVFVNNQWLFINRVLTTSASEAIKICKDSQPVYKAFEWKAEND